MINQVTLVGRVVEKPTLRLFEGETNVTTLNLAVVRPFKNMEGNYDTDFIKITLWNVVAQTVCEYTKKGDILGVKARLAMKDTEVNFASGEETFKKKISVIEVIGERVVFIATNSKKNQVNEEVSE